MSKQNATLVVELPFIDGENGFGAEFQLTPLGSRWIYIQCTPDSDEQTRLSSSRIVVCMFHVCERNSLRSSGRINPLDASLHLIKTPHLYDDEKAPSPFWIELVEGAECRFLEIRWLRPELEFCLKSEHVLKWRHISMDLLDYVKLFADSLMSAQCPFISESRK